MPSYVGQALQAALIVTAAPGLTGVIKRAKCRFQRRQGPSLLQPYRDIRKLLRKRAAVSTLASPVFGWAPYVVFACVVSAAYLLPSSWNGPDPGAAGLGRALLFAGLLSAVRLVSALAATDTAGSFGGMGSSRELFIGCMVEPSLLGVLVLASSHGAMPMALGAVALAILTIAETGRIPVDNPDTHLELTMVHEGMLLEYSGTSLALMTWAAHAKQLIFAVLMATLFVPTLAGLGWPPGTSPVLGVIAGAGWYVVRIALVGFGLAACECVYAKMRLFRLPSLLLTAWVLLALGAAAAVFVG